MKNCHNQSAHIIHTGIADTVVIPALSCSMVQLLLSQLTEVDSILLEQYSHPPPISDKLTWNPPPKKHTQHTQKHACCCYC